MLRAGEIAAESHPTRREERPRYRTRRSHKRREQQARLLERVTVPISDSVRRHDPLERPAPSPARVLRKAALYLAIALIFEGAVVWTLAVLPEGVFTPAARQRVVAEKVVVSLVQPEPEPPVDPGALIPEAPVEQPTAPAPLRTIIKKTPPKAVPRTSKREPPPADPVDIAEQPAPETPRRRVVGLNFSSTIQGGSGPSFAVGNTRMGQTGAVAEDVKEVAKLAGKRLDKAPATGANRGAAYIPGSAVRFEKPKRIGQAALDYPATLKAQGIEGNVIVLIEISPEGAVQKARILKSSGHEEFDAAAKKAALKQRFKPARRAGEPVNYTLKYTYRFRLKEV